jgi:DNA-directed RNA polymerase specialized sigma24 family protein
MAAAKRASLPARKVVTAGPRREVIAVGFINLARQEIAPMPQSWMSPTPHSSTSGSRPVLPNASALDDDARLVKQCRRGNERAWNLLVDRYQRLIYSVPVKLGLSADECAGVFYAVCVELLNSIDHLPRRVSLSDWVIDAAARHSWRRQRGLGEPEGTRVLSCDLRKELRTEQTFRQALAALPDSSQEMLRLLSTNPAKSSAEIAAELSRTFSGFEYNSSWEDICDRFEELG